VDTLDGPKELCQRLLELGFKPGQTFHIVQKTPFGDPIVIEVDETTVALRQEELRCLRVTS